MTSTYTPVSSLSTTALTQRLRNGSFILRTGPLSMGMQTDLPEIAPIIQTLYAENHVEEPGGFADFHSAVRYADSLRAWIKPQVIFENDAIRPFAPLPRPQGFAMLEWGMNWCIANYCHQYLTIHAAVIERNGLAAIMPAPPGSGKSTLCAALVHRGWRLLSDEITLIEPRTGHIAALARPINLKNASIDIIRNFAPEAVFGPLTLDTKKGTVVHIKAPADSLLRINETAQPRWIIFPRYQAGAAPTLAPLSRHHAFLELASNSFNYSILGEKGFTVLGNTIEQSECLSFTYSKLDDGITVFDRLAQEAGKIVEKAS